MKLKFIVMATLLFFIVPNAEAQSCTGCDVTLTPGGTGDLNVPAGQIWCLQSGTYNSGQSHLPFNIASGGTLCIGTGATYFVGWSSNVQGTIINHGTLNIDGISSTWNVHIENYGTITVTGSLSGNIDGLIDNHGTITFKSGVNQFSADINNDSNASFIAQDALRQVSGSIINYGLFQAKTFTSTDSAYVDNRDSFVVSGGQANVKGGFDNSGYAYFYGLNSGDGLSANVNNYGLFKTEGALSIGTATYLINDSTVIFSGADVHFEGPMLTNNGRMNVIGGFKVNSPQTEFSNTGMLYVTGDFNYNQAASGANNCRIYVGGNVEFHTGSFINEGLIWSAQTITVNSGDIKNNGIGFIRGKNFVNHESMSGDGSLYFTGTLTNSGASLAGKSAAEPMKFYNATGNPITQGTVTNVSFYTTSSIIPKDTISFDCDGAPPLPPVGNPPYVKGDTVLLCHIGFGSYTFHLLADSLIVPYDSTYYIYWPALKLFSVKGAENTTNLTTPQGTWVVDTVNKTIVFTPAASFTYGPAAAQFKVADKTPGDPITYTSDKATLVIHFFPAKAPDSLNAEGY